MTLLLICFKSLNKLVLRFETKYKAKTKEMLAYNAYPLTLLLKTLKEKHFNHIEYTVIFVTAQQLSQQAYR